MTCGGGVGEATRGVVGASVGPETAPSGREAGGFSPSAQPVPESGLTAGHGRRLPASVRARGCRSRGTRRAWFGRHLDRHAPDGERGHGSAQRVIRGKHAVACFKVARPSMAPAACGGRSQRRGLARPPRQPPAGRCRCLRDGGTRSASRSRSSNGKRSTTPFAPGHVDFRERPGPTQLAALCRGST